MSFLFNLILSLSISISLLKVGSAVFSRFSCSELGKSTQTCNMECNEDGSCIESLRIISCNCDGDGTDSFDRKYYKNGDEVSYLKNRKLPYSPYVKKRSLGGYNTACDNLPTRCFSCIGGDKSGGSATKWQNEFCEVYEDGEFFGRLR